MDNLTLEQECRTLAAYTEAEEDDRFATMKDGLIEQICLENDYKQDQATLIVESTTRRLRGEKPERVATLALRDGVHPLRSGGILIVKDNHIHELHTPLRPARTSSFHKARRTAVEEANKAAGCTFDVACLWEQTKTSWVAHWFRAQKPPG